MDGIGLNVVDVAGGGIIAIFRTYLIKVFIIIDRILGFILNF